MPQRIIERSLIADDTDRKEPVRVRVDGADADVVWLNPEHCENGGQGPAMLMQVHGECMLISVWDNADEDPVLSLRLDTHGRVSACEIAADIANRVTFYSRRG